MEIALLTIRIFLFLIFALAAVGKFLDRDGTAKTLREFGVPSGVSAASARVLPIAEIVIAILFLHVDSSWLGAVSAAVLLTTFTGAMLWQLRNENPADCHCFGQLSSEPVGVKSIARNLVLLVLAAVLIFAGRADQGLNIFGPATEGTANILIILGLVSALLLAAVLFLLKQVFERQSEMIERLEVLEVFAEGGSVVREGLQDPTSGLPIGVPVPSFSVRNLEDVSVSSTEIFGSGRLTLLIMVSPTCAPCEALFPEIQGWMDELGDDLDIVLLSIGSSEENAKKFPDADPQKFLLQKDKEISEALGTKWTPTAILIGRDRRIASRPAAGDQAIRELVKRIKEIKIENGDAAVIGAALAGGNGNKINQAVPDFDVEDLEGRRVTAGDFFQGRETIVASWSSTCPHCADMIGELREWDRSGRTDGLELLVIAMDLDQNIEDFGLVSTVVLDNEELLLGRKFGLPGPPSAVRVNREGKIVSEPAIGADQIWKLIGN